MLKEDRKMEPLDIMQCIIDWYTISHSEIFCHICGLFLSKGYEYWGQDERQQIGKPKKKNEEEQQSQRVKLFSILVTVWQTPFL